MKKRTSLLMLCLTVLSAGMSARADEAAMADNPKSIQDVTRADASPQDEKLSEEVRQALKDDGSIRKIASDIQLKTVNGIVHLKGSVRSEEEKTALENKVRALPGVSDVRNFIRVAGH